MVENMTKIVKTDILQSLLGAMIYPDSRKQNSLPMLLPTTLCVCRLDPDSQVVILIYRYQTFIELISPMTLAAVTLAAHNYVVKWLACPGMPHTEQPHSGTSQSPSDYLCEPLYHCIESWISFYKNYSSFDVTEIERITCYILYWSIWQGCVVVI